MYESWQAVIALRSTLEGECAQQLLHKLVDDKVLDGLALAHLLRDTVIDEGLVPAELLQTQLKQGPGKHINSHAHRYQRKLNQELARIARIQTLQQRAVVLLGTTIGSALVGIATFASRTARTPCDATNGPDALDAHEVN